MRSVAIAMLLIAGSPAPRRASRTAKPTTRLIVVNAKKSPVIYIDGTRRVKPLTIELVPTRKPVDCKRLPTGATCRITY